MATAAPTATGRVIQITGPVVDIEFPAGGLPAIYNAVEIERGGLDPLVCEVQQHLGNNWVRSVAMTTTDGLARGTAVLDTSITAAGFTYDEYRAPGTNGPDDPGTGFALHNPVLLPDW